MKVLVFLIPIALFIFLLSIILFLWFLKNNQFEDPEKGASQIFVEDDEE